MMQFSEVTPQSNFFNFPNSDCMKLPTGNTNKNLKQVFFFQNLPHSSSRKETASLTSIKMNQLYFCLLFSLPPLPSRTVSDVCVGGSAWESVIMSSIEMDSTDWTVTQYLLPTPFPTRPQLSISQLAKLTLEFGKLTFFYKLERSHGHQHQNLLSLESDWVQRTLWLEKHRKGSLLLP